MRTAAVAFSLIRVKSSACMTMANTAPKPTNSGHVQSRTPGPCTNGAAVGPGRGGLRSCDVELPGGVVRSFDALGTDSPTTSGDSADSRSHREAFPRWNTVDVGDPLETFRFAARAVAGSSEQNRQIGSNLGRFSPVRCCEPLWFYLRERFSAPTAGRSEFRCSGRLVVTQWPGNAFSARWLGGHRLFGDGRRRRCLSQGRGWRRRCFTQIRRCGRCGQFFHGTTGRTGPSTGCCADFVVRS